MTVCTRHTEHAINASRGGLVGRHFPDNNRWPEGLWESCDSEMGEFVYCHQHLRPHGTGWCTVSNRDKTPLLAETVEDAYAEVRAAGWPIYGETAP